MIEFLLTTIHVLVSIFLILVVLLQQGKGADLSVFGGGGTQTAFGARGAATILHKMTVFGFVSFIITTILIGVFVGTGGGGSSVMEDLAAGETAVEAPVDGAADGAVDGAVDGVADETDVDPAGQGAGPVIGVGAESSSPGIEVEAEPVEGDGVTSEAANEAGSGNQ